MISAVLGQPGTLKPAGNKLEPLEWDKHGVNLLIDTGASRTCISPAVADKFKLTPTGKSPVHGAGGQVDLNTYVVDLGIPFPIAMQPGGAVTTSVFTMQNVELGEVLIDNGFPFQGLLGRDVLCRGSLNVHGNLCIFCL